MGISTNLYLTPLTQLNDRLHNKDHSEMTAPKVRPHISVLEYTGSLFNSKDNHECVCSVNTSCIEIFWDLKLKRPLHVQ